MPKGILFMRLFLSKFTFPEAFMRYFNNFDAFMKLVLSMKDGFGNTLMIFFFTLLFSLPLEQAEDHQRADVAVHPCHARYAADAANLRDLFCHSDADGRKP